MNEPFGNSLGATVFLWALLTLFSFRTTRLITDDLWPPSLAFRRFVKDRFGDTSAWFDLVTCSWCAGTYVTIAIFAIAAQLFTISLPVLQTGAAMTIVGLIGNHDS